MHFSDFVPRGPATAIPAPDEGVDGARWISQPPPDPGFAATRNWLESHLDDDEHDQLVPWLNHQADPAKYPDPTTTEEEDHRCDLSDPTYNNAGGNTTPSPLTPKVPAPFEAADRPDGAIGTLDPYLRWGETNWLGTFIDNWSQWGWRHIQAKHGWGNDDLLATTNTLSQPVRTVPQGTGVDGNPNGEPTAMLYAGPEYEQNGARCERRVVVEYGIQAPETEPKGIITSYGHSLGNAN